MLNMKKIRHIDFRQLKDNFFKGIEDDNVLGEKAILLVLYEHTLPESEKGMSEDELIEKTEIYSIYIIFEANAREGVMEVKYDKYGTPKTAKLTEKGIKETEEKLGKYL